MFDTFVEVVVDTPRGFTNGCIDADAIAAIEECHPRNEGCTQICLVHLRNSTHVIRCAHSYDELHGKLVALYLERSKSRR